MQWVGCWWLYSLIVDSSSQILPTSLDLHKSVFHHSICPKSTFWKRKVQICWEKKEKKKKSEPALLLLVSAQFCWQRTETLVIAASAAQPAVNYPNCLCWRLAVCLQLYANKGLWIIIKLSLLDFGSRLLLLSSPSCTAHCQICLFCCLYREGSEIYLDGCRIPSQCHLLLKDIHFVLYNSVAAWVLSAAVSLQHKNKTQNHCCLPWNIYGPISSLITVFTISLILRTADILSQDAWVNANGYQWLLVTLTRPKPHRPPTTDRAINLQQIVLQSRPTNQEACRVTKHPLNLSLLVFSEDDYCLCLWRWIEQATSKDPPTPHPSHSPLSLHCTVMALRGDTIWWWNESVQLQPQPTEAPHVTSTEDRERHRPHCGQSAKCDTTHANTIKERSNAFICCLFLGSQS